MISILEDVSLYPPLRAPNFRHLPWSQARGVNTALSIQVLSHAYHACMKGGGSNLFMNAWQSVGMDREFLLHRLLKSNISLLNACPSIHIYSTLYRTIIIIVTGYVIILVSVYLSFLTVSMAIIGFFLLSFFFILIVCFMYVVMYWDIKTYIISRQHVPGLVSCHHL
jgi:hypothetical protein